jgi:aminoglycoside phosphotransferase (APT) family kinase protein
VALARRVAEAIHKLHRAGMPSERAHTAEDELRILRDCLARVAASKPELRARLEAILASCEKLGASVAGARTCGIHRDFYAAQVIVDGERLWLIDFDLYCQGDPGLDVGNFIGHITEESLRTLGDAGALRDREQALEDRFVELSGEGVRASVRAYTMLTLARHIYLSTQFAERTAWTERIVELCEQRLGDL